MKALSADLHLPSVGVYCNEASLMPHLPPELPVPRLLDAYDDGNWVALVYEDTEGRHPEIPWRSDELDRVAGAIADLGAALDPSPWRDAPDFADVNASFIQAWRAIVMSPPSELDPAVRLLLDKVAADEVDLMKVVRGEALLHNDIRSDNILLTRDGQVVFVNWGMPCKGAVWQDLVMFAFTAAFQGGADADTLVRTPPVTRDIASSSIDVVVLGGYAAYRLLAQRLVDPRMPDSNAYHIVCAEASLR